MKIFFVTRGFPSEKNLMMGNYESVQARALAKMGHEVINICKPAYKSELHLFDRPRLTCRTVDGVKVYEKIAFYPYLLGIIRRPLWLSNFIIKRGYRRLIREVMKREGTPDVVHMHILYVAYYAIATNCFKNIPIVITEHWTFMQFPSEHRQLSWMTKAYSGSDAVIAVSNSLSKSVQHYYDKPVRTIYNMVGDSFWDSVPKLENDSKFHFISVGRLCDNKHFDMLIDAFAQCKFPDDTILDIVGEGENRASLEKQIKDRNLQDKVILHGLKKSEEVAQMLASADCFVLSSRLETFGIVLIEAMAKGLPVVATHCGGPEEFVTKESGMIVPNDDVNAFAAAMRKMKVEAGKYNREGIKKYCYDHFSQTAIASKIVEVYKSVIKK